MENMKDVLHYDQTDNALERSMQNNVSQEYKILAF